MSKNKFRALLFLVIIIGGYHGPNFHEGSIDTLVDLVLTGFDIILNLVFMGVYFLAFVFAIHYGVKAWNEDN